MNELLNNQRGRLRVVHALAAYSMSRVSPTSQEWKQSPLRGHSGLQIRKTGRGLKLGWLRILGWTQEHGNVIDLS